MSANLHLLGIDLFPIDLFQAILCAIENLALSFLAVIVLALNNIMISIGGLISAFASVLPTFGLGPTDGPQHFDSGVLGWIDYFFPIETFISLWTSIVSLFLVLLGIRIIGKWVKAF
jgi:hypothetical protein